MWCYFHPIYTIIMMCTFFLSWLWREEEKHKERKIREEEEHKERKIREEEEYWGRMRRVEEESNGRMRREEIEHNEKMRREEELHLKRIAYFDAHIAALKVFMLVPCFLGFLFSRTYRLGIFLKQKSKLNKQIMYWGCCNLCNSF